MDTKALSKIDYGLYILTVKEQEKDNGCVLNTVMQITSTPLQILVAINKKNATHDQLLQTGICNISILDHTAPFSLFEHFGFQSGKLVNKFASWDKAQRSANGLLYLTEYSNAYLSAKVNNSVDYGTHTLFTLEIVDGQVLADTPSLTYTEYHQKVKPKPQTNASGYRCIICGYIYEGDTLPEDFICPLCKHGAIDFEPIQ